MKTTESDVRSRQARIVRSATVFLLALSLALPALSLALPARAQSPPAAVPQPAPAAQQPDEDPLGRSTPYGTVTGFLRATRDKDYARAAKYLDTKKKPAAAEELAEQLQIVLDRGLVSDIDRLSRKPEGSQGIGLPGTRDKVGTVETPTRRVEIFVERVERRGQGPIWLFSAESFALVPDIAEELSEFDPEQHLPRFLVDFKIGSWPLYRWIGILIGLPLALLLGTLVTRALIPLLRPLFRRLTGEEDDRTLGSIRTPIRLILIAVAIRLLSSLSLSLASRQFWTRVAVVVGVLGLAWLMIRLNGILSEMGTRSLHRRGMTGKTALRALARRLFNITVVIATGLYLLHRAGADLTAVLTGLGIGGIGLALAAQKTLENLFGGVMLITDEPLRVGDFCRVGDLTGTVEDIGLRSTRIRTLSRTVVSVPNGQLASMNVENFAMRDKFWFRHVIGVRYETTADQLRCVLAGIRGMLYSHSKVERDGARIRFVGFGGSSLDLEIFAYVNATEMADFLAIQEDLLLRIMDIIAEAGTGIAFPSQTTYLAKDASPDPQKKEEAVARVRQWRERDELPFPDFRADEVREMHGRIEYPPQGSSHRVDPGSK